MWRLVVSAADNDDSKYAVEKKEFKPKYPGIPRRKDYKTPAPAEFWRNFPVNSVRLATLNLM
jgi:hypothetical protein